MVDDASPVKPLYDKFVLLLLVQVMVNLDHSALNAVHLGRILLTLVEE